jgi:hypothetical protein
MKIDTSDIRELTKEDFAKGRKNPYAEKLIKNGYKIIINVTPEDIAEMSERNIEQINSMESMDWLDLDPEEIEALKTYREGLEHPSSSD